MENEKNAEFWKNQTFEENLLKEKFIFVEASALSLDDDFMQHYVKSGRQKEFMKLLKKVIIKGVKDFYKPKCDPSIDRLSAPNKICFKPNKIPATGHSFSWWENAAKEYDPSRGSRLGTKSEYIAFLGCILKEMVDSGWHVNDAWRAVCDESCMIGHYWDSDKKLHVMESTGSKEFFDFCDLANVCKFVAGDKNEGGFNVVAGSYLNSSFDFPLAYICPTNARYNVFSDCVGWVILER